MKFIEIIKLFKNSLLFKGRFFLVNPYYESSDKFPGRKKKHLHFNNLVKQAMKFIEIVKLFKNNLLFKETISLVNLYYESSDNLPGKKKENYILN